VPTAAIEHLRNRLRCIKLLIVSGRPMTAAIALLVTALIAANGLALEPLTLILRCSPILLITMAGFVINDIFDVQKDKIAGVMRPISSGNLGVCTALYYSVALLFAALLIELLLGTLATTSIIAATSIGVVVYSPMARLLPLAKGLFTAMLSCSPLIYGGYLIGISPTIWLLLLGSAYVIGREVLLDAKDCDGDRRAGVSTIAVLVGPQPSFICAFFLMFLAAIVGMIVTTDIRSRTLIGFSIACLLTTAFYSKCEPCRAVFGTRLALLFGGCGFAFQVGY